MSRIGKQPILLPHGVTTNLSAGTITVQGPKGTLVQAVPSQLAVTVADGTIVLSRSGEDRVSKSLHGLMRTLIANMVTGVTQGWKKELEMRGVGYRANLSGESLVLSVGYSHPVTVAAPEGIQFTVRDTTIVVEGIDKATVGQIAATIRKVKPPEPYKGKGIRYVGERVRRKAGKTGKVGAQGGTR